MRLLNSSRKSVTSKINVNSSGLIEKLKEKWHIHLGIFLEKNRNHISMASKWASLNLIRAISASENIEIYLF